jgi:uncharacterized protein YjbI with pentapeptide repeats
MMNQNVTSHIVGGWDICADSDCTGSRLPDGSRCWAHAKEPDLDAALERLSQGGRLDARGVPITNDLLRRLLAAVPRSEDDRPVLVDATFDTASFLDDIHFENAVFRSSTEFSRATFHGKVSFEEAVFFGPAWFIGAHFRKLAHFAGADFHKEALFRGATFHYLMFFHEARFQGDLSLLGVTCQSDAEFPNAHFLGAADFTWVVIGSEASFDGAVFEEARDIGPLLVHDRLVLDRALFKQPVRIEASTVQLHCRRARFTGGVQFRLRWAQAVFTDTEFAGPSIVTGIPDIGSDTLAAKEEQMTYDWLRLPGETVSERPRLISLQRALVGGVSLSGVDMSDCRLAGALNLDALRMEANVVFGIAPNRRMEWERRRVIAEECAWRNKRSGRWTVPAWPSWAGDPPPPLEPGQIAGLYRALRKGRDDSRDEPGAADFYYGEMEMRRYARHNPPDSGRGNQPARSRLGLVERGILTAYWLMSGYGLRAWRAIAWLMIAIAGLAVAFHLIGFSMPPQPDSYWTSMLYAFRATLSLTDDQVKLTAWGRLLQAMLRLTGPVLLGLALLALRNRVKR